MWGWGRLGMHWYVLEIALPGEGSGAAIILTRKRQIGSCGIRGWSGLGGAVVLIPIRLGWGSIRVLVVIVERWLLLGVDLGSAKGVSNEWRAGGFEARWSGGLGRERLV